MSEDLNTMTVNSNGRPRHAWRLVSDCLPTEVESATFGGVECILQCRGSHDMQVLRFARPVFIGGNPNKVLWLDASEKSGSPIENAAWEVTHWRPFPAFPKPLPQRTKA